MTQSELATRIGNLVLQLWDYETRQPEPVKPKEKEDGTDQD